MGRDFFTVTSQLNGFLLSLCIGLAIGVFYDLFRIIRLCFSEGKASVIIQDLIFWISAGLVSFLFVFVINNGEYRAYFAVGQLIGFFVYYFTCGVLVMKISAVLVRWVKAFARAVFRVVSFPFRKIFLVFHPKMRNMTKSARKNLKKSANKGKFILKRNRVMMYNKSINNSKDNE